MELVILSYMPIYGCFEKSKLMLVSKTSKALYLALSYQRFKTLVFLLALFNFAHGQLAKTHDFHRTAFLVYFFLL